MDPNLNPNPNPPQPNPTNAGGVPGPQLGNNSPQLANSSFGGRTIEPLNSTAEFVDPAPETPAVGMAPVYPTLDPPAPATPDLSFQAPAAQPLPQIQPPAAPYQQYNPTAPMPPTPPQQPLAPTNLPQLPVEPAQAGPFVGSDMASPEGTRPFIPTMPNQQDRRRRLSLKSKPVLAGVVILILVGIFAGYWFGYKNNPSVIYSQTMKGMAKGYDKLIEYADKQSQAKYKGTVGEGSFSVNVGGSSSDGKINYKSDDKSGQLTFDLGIAGSRISADIRAIDAGGSSDLYFQVSGLKSIGALAGSPDLDKALAKIDGNWVVIDHTLVDSLAGGQSTDPSKMPTTAQALDAAKKMSTTNRDYLFSSNKNKGVLQVVEKVGAENIDGHKTYHYKVSLDPDNVKAYIDASKESIKSSKLWSWVQKNGYESDFNSVFDELKTSAQSIKSSDTFDLWAETSQHIIYKVRFNDKTNPSSNFVDIGLDYKGGDEFPFFIASQSQVDSDKVTLKVVMTLNTSTSAVGIRFDAKGTGSSAGAFTMKLNLKPSNETVKVQKPANAKTLGQLMNELGYGSLYKQLLESAAN